MKAVRLRPGWTMPKLPRGGGAFRIVERDSAAGAAAAPDTAAIVRAPSVAPIRPRRSVSNFDVLMSRSLPIRLFAAMALLHTVLLQRPVDGRPLQERDQSARGFGIGG